MYILADYTVVSSFKIMLLYFKFIYVHFCGTEILYNYLHFVSGISSFCKNYQCSKIEAFSDE